MNELTDSANSKLVDIAGKWKKNYCNLKGKLREAPNGLISDCIL